jgi:hypothetical protein
MMMTLFEKFDPSQSGSVSSAVFPNLHQAASRVSHARLMSLAETVDEITTDDHVTIDAFFGWAVGQVTAAQASET